MCFRCFFVTPFRLPDPAFRAGRKGAGKLGRFQRGFTKSLTKWAIVRLKKEELKDKRFRKTTTRRLKNNVDRIAIESARLKHNAATNGYLYMCH